MSQIKVKFVSRKISKVRWKPKNSAIFVTASYDDEENIICVWKFPDLSTKEDDENEEDPQPVAYLPFPGCVTDLKIINESLLCASSSLGDIYMCNYSDEEIRVAHRWERVHSLSGGESASSATGLSVKGQEIVSVGEDGALCLFNYDSKEKVSKIEDSDVCSYTAVAHLRHQEVCAGNSLGFLLLWDFRTTSKATNVLLPLSRDQRGVSSLCVHPSQPHVLATGYEDGTLCVWDMRDGRHPTSLLGGHAAPVSEVLFHPARPDFLFTGSWDGSLWQWDASLLSSSAAQDCTNQGAAAKSGNPWLLYDESKHGLDVVSLSSSSTCINSLDLMGSSLVWGTDNEEICFLHNILT